MIFLNKIISNNKELFAFTCLTYLDKFLFFILPLVFLYLTNDVDEYNKLEYIYSISNLLMILLDFGVKYYIFYGYSISENRNNYLDQIKKYYLLLFCVSIIIFFVLIFTGSGFYKYIVIRSTFLVYLVYFSYHFRLIDKPNGFFKYSISVSFLTLPLLFLVSIVNKNYIDINLYFIPQITIILVIIVSNFKSLTNIRVCDIFTLLKASISYTWPLILNTFLGILLVNFIKIFGYNKFESDRVFEIYFTLRIGLIIHLAHKSVLGYYSKKIFISKDISFDIAVFKKYVLFILIAVLFVILFFLLQSFFNILNNVNISLSYLQILLVMYIALRCVGSYLEIYFNKLNKNKTLMLSYSVVLTVFLGCFLLLYDIISPEIIGFLMLSSSLLYLMLLLYNLKKYKVI